MVFCAGQLFGSYQYLYQDPLTSINAAKWQQNGSVAASGAGLTSTDLYTGGSLISKDPPADDEVKITLNLVASGGIYVAYLRASLDALSPSGT